MTDEIMSTSAPALYHATKAKRFSLMAAIGATIVVALEYLAHVSPLLLIVFAVTASAAWYNFARQAMLVRSLRRLAG